ncbi:hypothetical protein HU200_027002 [Digitaria exilis]|uniref:Uncharacterized protein n=1 Tax=Digitaria exilis TaxID=1010633 RepID=A0A835ER56_9POAL|nr:hypothetical protein HU200_027002 [Digitaria exilis]
MHLHPLLLLLMMMMMLLLLLLLLLLMMFLLLPLLMIFQLLVLLLLVLLLLLMLLLLLLVLLLFLLLLLVKRPAFLMMSVYPMHGLPLGITSGVHLVEKRKAEKEQLAERKKQGKDEADKKGKSTGKHKRAKITVPAVPVSPRVVVGSTSTAPLRLHRALSAVAVSAVPVSPRVVVRPTSAAPLRLPRAVFATHFPTRVSGQFARPPRPFVSHACCSVQSARTGLFIPFLAIDIPSSPAEATVDSSRGMDAPGGTAPYADAILGVWSGDQDRIVLAVVRQDIFKPAVTVSVVVNHVMGRYTIPIVHDDDHDRVFLVRLPYAGDVERFHGHTWTWWSEEVFFRRVLRVVHDGDLTPTSTRPLSCFAARRVFHRFNLLSPPSVSPFFCPYLGFQWKFVQLPVVLGF